MNKELNCGEVINFIEARNRHHLSHLDSKDISDEQKEEFLKALWTVIVAFVDFGYGVHPVQEAGSAKIITLPTRRSSCSNVSSEIGETAHV